MSMRDIITCEIVLRWVSKDLDDDYSTLVQVMAWCHQATNHCLGQWWPCSLSLGHNRLKINDCASSSSSGISINEWFTNEQIGAETNWSPFADDIKCISCVKWLQFHRDLLQMPNQQALAQIMTWHQIDDKPLPEPKKVLFTDVDMRHAASLS